jgi:hypothetical protein
MQIDRRLVGFGLFLVTVGAVMLAVRQGWLPEGTAGRAWSLWPLLLVGAGLSVALARRSGGGLGGLLIALTLGAMAGGFASTGSLGLGSCSGDANSGTSFPDASGTFGGTARIEVSQSCGDLAISTAPGAAWSVGGVGAEDGAPVVDSTSERVSIRSDTDRGFGVSAGPTAWQLRLPREPLLTLDVEANAGGSRIQLGGARLASVSVERNAGSLDLDLRDVAALDAFRVALNAGSATIHLPALPVAGEMEVNAGSATICRPVDATIGLRIRTDGGFAASNDFRDEGLVETDDGWETPGFATAAVRITIEAKVNAGSLSLDATRACAG